jgi:hypothetical protein
MESSSLTHDPLTYRFLPDFTVPCFAGNQVLTGLECWGDVSNPDVNFGNPRVNLNASSSENNFHPPHTLSQIPGPTSLSIIAWQGPVNGNVKVVGTYTHLESCVTGVIWSVDQGGITLKSGELFTGSASFSLSRVQVREDDVLYFTVDPDGNFNCDTTGLKLTISTSQNQQ